MGVAFSQRWRNAPFVRAWARFQASGPSLLAAAVAFNVFFALTPLALVFLSVTALIGSDAAIRGEIVDALTGIAPPEVIDLITSVLDNTAEVLAGSEGVVIVVSLIVALYSGSRATVAIVRALTLSEQVTDTRSFWQRRLVGIALTVVGAAAFLLALGVILIGTALADDLGEMISFSGLETVTSLGSVPLVGGALLTYLAAVYHFGPPRPLPGVWLCALLGTAGALAISWGFTWFLSLTGGVGGLVGAVATLGVLLIWLYLGALVIIAAAYVGGEIRKGRALNSP